MTQVQTLLRVRVRFGATREVLECPVGVLLNVRPGESLLVRAPGSAPRSLRVEERGVEVSPSAGRSVIGGCVPEVQVRVVLDLEERVVGTREAFDGEVAFFGRAGFASSGRLAHERGRWEDATW